MRTLRNVFQVGSLKCDMTFSKKYGIRAEWEGPPTEVKQFSAQEWAQYRAGRNALVSEIEKVIGGRVLVAEIPGGRA